MNSLGDAHVDLDNVDDDNEEYVDAEDIDIEEFLDPDDNGYYYSDEDQDCDNLEDHEGDEKDKERTGYLNKLRLWAIKQTLENKQILSPFSHSFLCRHSP